MKKITTILCLLVATACHGGNVERFIITDSQRQQVLADAGTNDALVVSIDNFPTDAAKQDALTIGTNNVATVCCQPPQK